MYRIIGGDGNEYGPVGADDLRRWIAEGRVNALTKVQLEGSADWRPLSDFPEFGLAGAFTGAVPSSRFPSAVPTFVKVFSILNMVFGGLGLLCSPFAFVGIPATLRMMGDTPLLRGWLMFSAVWSLLGAGVLLASGIGLWGLKAWARKLAVFYAALAIVMGLIAVTVTVASIGSNSAMHGSQKIGGIVGGVIGGMVGLVYNVLVIYFLSKREAKLATGELAT